MINVTQIPAKIFLGRGIDKKFPILVSLYKKVYFVVSKDKEITVNIPLNLKLIVSSKDTGLGMYLRTKNEFEPIQTNLFLKEVKRGEAILDIGANIGYYTVLGSKLVGNKGKVYAFEPDPNNLKLLRKNIKLNNCQNVTVFPYAVGSKNSKGYLKIDRSNPGESKLTQNTHSMPVKIVSLDSFLKTKAINLIKIDIEGGEVNALNGAQKTIKKQKILKLFIECKAEELSEELKNLGFKIEKIINEFKKMQSKFSINNLSENLKTNSYVTLYAKKQ